MNLRFAPCSYCDRKPGFYSEGINYCWVHWYSKDEISKDQSNKNKQIIFKNNKNNNKEEYNRLIFKINYEREREDYGVKKYIEDGGEPWDIAPEKFWFEYNTCKNPECQENGIDWYENNFYCNDECEKEAKINIEQIYKKKNTFERKINKDHKII